MFFVTRFIGTAALLSGFAAALPQPDDLIDDANGTPAVIPRAM